MTATAIGDVVHVLSGGAAKGLVEGLRDGFQREAAAGIVGHFGAVGAMRELLEAGEPCDVAILTAAVIEALVASGHVVAGSAVPLGRVVTGLAVATGQPAPAVVDGPSLARALTGATALYLPDPERATAGIHFAGVLARLGIDAEVQSRLRAFPNGAAAMAALARDGVPGAIGCTQKTEILYTAGVSWLAPLPAGFDLATRYTAAVATRSVDPGRARRLVELLSGPEATDLRRAGGFDAA